VRKRTTQSLAVGGGLWLDRKGRDFLGARRIELLEGIERTGSITRAAREIGLSYKAAWDALEAMSNLADRPLLIRSTGGRRGGGTQLTDRGRELVRLYRLMESGYRRLLAQMQRQVDDFEKLNQLVGAITLRTSARNQLRGTVKTVRKGAVNADVVLDLGEGLEVFANITNEAVSDLALQPGREAVALIKASSVLLSPDAKLRISARNQLRGTVAKVIPGKVNTEVKLALSGGRTLAAVVTNEAIAELAIKEGSACTALIKASHVLIAVND
jgi:molybdate transport system regulatory protein